MIRWILKSLVILYLISEGTMAKASEPLMAIEIATKENTLDSCMDCGCRSKGIMTPRKGGNWWVTFGLVRSDDQSGWQAISSSSRCGVGSFKMIAADFKQTVGNPYIVLDLSLTSSNTAKGDVDLKIKASALSFSGFDEKGRSLYEVSLQDRMLSFSEEGSIALPVLISNKREKESFGVHEVLLVLRATSLARESPSEYGTVEIAADMPGAEVLLDGGFVGRIEEERPLILKNIRAGQRKVGIRDFSGREAHRPVMVKKNKTTIEELEVLDLPAAKEKAILPLGQNPQGYDEFWRVRDAAVVVKIPAGEFLRGTDKDKGEPHEQPPRSLHISDFFIDKTEVTWRQFKKFAEAKRAQLPAAPLWGTPEDYPASNIVWEEAQEYCKWVGGRLPTEAEWEKAARGSDGRKYPWGNEWYHDRCNSRDGGPHRPLSAGGYPNCLSPYGVLNMAGNVWEWCADWYGESYYAKSPHRDPRGPTDGSMKVLRGGAWITPGQWLRAAFRYKVSPTYRRVHYGFRCAQDAPE